MAQQKDDLAERIAKARSELEPKTRNQLAQKYNAVSLAWRMTVELVVGTGIGLAIGFGLDSLFGTKPVFLIVFLLFGLAAGIRVMLATAQQVSRSSDNNASESLK